MDAPEPEPSLNIDLLEPKLPMKALISCHTAIRIPAILLRLTIQCLSGRGILETAGSSDHAATVVQRLLNMNTHLMAVKPGPLSALQVQAGFCR